MKNMSFGKMLGLFAGFLVVMAIAAVVIVKMNSKGGNNAKPVMTKTYQKPPAAEVPAADPAAQPAAQAQDPAAVAQAGQGQGGTNDQAVFQPMGNTGSNQAQTVQNTSTTGSSQVQAPLVAGQGLAQGVAQGAAGNLAAARQVAPQPVAVPSDIDARVAALESKLESKCAPASSAHGSGGHKSGSQQHATSTASKAKPKKPVEETASADTTQLPGYKSMAVVSNRAWIAAPDGNEDSLVKGEQIPAPRPRIRSMNVDSGIVITTSDQRIEPNVEQRINQRPDQRISPNVDNRAQRDDLR